MSKALTEQCTRCHTTEFPNGRLIVRGKSFCYDRCKPVVDAARVRKARGRGKADAATVALNEAAKARQAVYAAKDDLREVGRDRESIIGSCKREAEKRAMARVRRMSVWQRVRFCFDPFAH